MNCKCGWLTIDHEVVREKKVIGNYVKCHRCGRVSWLWKADNFDEKFNAKRTTRLTKKPENRI